MEHGGSCGVDRDTAIADGEDPVQVHARRRVAIASGGTAGHIYPGLAVALAYRACVPGAEVVFLGTVGGMEGRLVPAQGYRLIALPAAPFARAGVRGKARAIASVVQGTLAARRVLRAERIDVVLGFGSYACVGPLVGARSLGIAALLHEANAVPGLASRLLRGVVDRVLLGTDSARDDVPSAGTAVTGVPLRSDLFACAAIRAAPAGRLHVLVSGGSGGSRFLDERVPDLLARIARHGVAVEARHLVGGGDVERTRAGYARAGVPAAVVSYADDVADAYAWAHFAVVCAGAGTLAELAAVGLPALVVPLAAAARDHQTANARAFAVATGAWWTREADWDADALAAPIARLAGDADAWTAASAAMRRAARPDAAAAVVAACEAALGVRAHAPRRRRAVG